MRILVLFCLCLIPLTNKIYARDVQRRDTYDKSSGTLVLPTAPNPITTPVDVFDRDASVRKAGDRLDDPRAMAGQIIVNPGKPRCLKYNGGGPAFLSGPDSPEDFLC